MQRRNYRAHCLRTLTCAHNMIVLLVRNGYPPDGRHEAIEKLSPKLKTFRGTIKDKKWTLSKFSNNLSEKNQTDELQCFWKKIWV